MATATRLSPEYLQAIERMSNDLPFNLEFYDWGKGSLVALPNGDKIPGEHVIALVEKTPAGPAFRFHLFEIPKNITEFSAAVQKAVKEFTKESQ